MALRDGKHDRGGIVIHRRFSAWNLASACGILPMVLDMARESAQGVVQRWGLASAAAVLLLQGCSIDPYRPAPPPPATWRSTPAPEPSVGDDIAVRAISLLGKPYVWGGADLTGFDCSGLVRFIYDQVGIPVPRTAAEQFSAAKPIDLAGLKPGDLLFFRTQGHRISHVAIYTGEGRFVHAPRTGQPVEFRMLDDEYYRPRLAGAGRLF
jgi:cell wall-associated NlpC family hydrolase